jgi:hypothetical protein
MTEDQARQKWCPFARYHPEIRGDAVQWKTASGAANRFDPETAGPKALASCRCLASDCMAWRWIMGTRDSGFCGLALPAVA